MSDIQHLDAPPGGSSGWFAVDVMRSKRHSRDWVVLMIDVDPDDMASRSWDDPVWLYVHPKNCRPTAPKGRHCWVRLQGKYRNRDAA
jgi:hypothetical protein